MIEKQIESFFHDVSKKKDKNAEFYKNTLYVLVNDAGWSQKDFEEAEIPFILDFISKKVEVNKEIERNNKKAMRKK